MRELGFSRLDWMNYNTGLPKLVQNGFSTFRFTRRDRDWEVGETVRVVYKPRSKADRSVLGEAIITSKTAKALTPVTGYKSITLLEAKADGFQSLADMKQYLFLTILSFELYTVNKLSLKWLKRYLYTPDQKPHVAKQWGDMLNMV